MITKKLLIAPAFFLTTLLVAAQDAQPGDPPKPTKHTTRTLEGWTVRVDDRLLEPPNEELGKRALRFLENKLADITVVVPAEHLKKLRSVSIVLDLSHGKLKPMQYHPSAGWLKANGYSTDLEKCVHIPRAADLATKRNINEQPWVILHELTHAYHDQVLGFSDSRIRKAFARYEESKRGEKTLLYSGKHVRHYALTNEKEFFAEMTEAYFGVNDFFPFNRAELKEAEPEIYALLQDIWEAPAKAKPGKTVEPLSVERIFNSREFEPDRAPVLRWRKRDSGYIVQESSSAGPELVAYDPAGKLREVLVPARLLIPAGKKEPLAMDAYEFSEDGSKLLIYTGSQRVWRVNSRGDYWVLDLATHALTKLGGDIPPASTVFATFSPDGKRVAYVHKNNLYVQDLADLRITPLTRNGSDTLINGTFDWVYEEELGLRNGFRWSPDSRDIAYWQLDAEGVKEFFITNSADGPYARLISIRYPKAGEKNSAARIGIVSAGGGETRWLEVPGDPREHYLAKMEWAGPEVALQQFNRLQNTNRVMLADPKTGKTRTIHTETDACWIENENDFRWVNNRQQLVWLSERDGWQHVYLVSANGEKPIQLTRGPFDVIRIEAIDEKNGWLYFLASPENPTQRYLYRVSLKGGTPQRLTPADSPGTHTYSMSADAQWAVHSYSTFTRPPVISLIHLSDHKVVRTFADNAGLKKKLDAIRLGSAEFLRVNIEPEVALDGWCIKPPGFDARKKYPVLFYVYGEPAGQTVLDRWDARRFLWHNMLAQEGYVVMSIDNRGTPAPRGRDWRRSIYRQVGILASADQAAAVKKLLATRPYMDAGRIAVWGWSGGGSMSLNAIFRYPDLYQTALAVAPVPNQRHYDTIYQERYMGLPTDNAQGYHDGSPIHHAHKLKGNLLIVHGTGDDNCHYLGVETLIDELIAHNKHFTLFSYPNRSHSINEGRNTTRHLYEGLTRFLKAHTPP